MRSAGSPLAPCSSRPSGLSPSRRRVAAQPAAQPSRRPSRSSSSSATASSTSPATTQMYRTQINDRPGVLLRSLDWTLHRRRSDGGLLDYFRVDASDIGAGPGGLAPPRGRRGRPLPAHFTWRRTDLYSALPAFANPFLDDGIIPGQQTYNRTRNIYDATLAAPSRARCSRRSSASRATSTAGPGTTTYHLGENEFPLNEQRQARSTTSTGSGSRSTRPVQGGVTQGWRQYRWTDTASLAPGAGDGNISVPILGQTSPPTGSRRTTNNKINTPVTNAWVTGQPLRPPQAHRQLHPGRREQRDRTRRDRRRQLRLLRDLALLLGPRRHDQLPGARRTTGADRRAPRLELAPNVDVTGGWTEKSRELTGSALADSLYLDTMTFGGVQHGRPPADRPEQHLAPPRRSHLRRDRHGSACSGPSRSTRAGPRPIRTSTSAPELSSLLVPGGARAGVRPHRQHLRRRLHVRVSRRSPSRATTGTTTRDQPIFRTDFIEPRPLQVPRGLELEGDRPAVGGTTRRRRADGRRRRRSAISAKVKEFAGGSRRGPLQEHA